MMRHDHLLLSVMDSLCVIDEVNAWCRRTGTNYNKLVTAARVAVSTRSAVRQRQRRLTIETATRLRTTMTAHPQGIGKAEHKARLSQVRQAFRPVEMPMRVDRSPCPMCGTRRDIGCVHWARFERGAMVG